MVLHRYLSISMFRSPFSKNVVAAKDGLGDTVTTLLNVYIYRGPHRRYINVNVT